LIVGKNTWIGPFVILDASGGPLIIGDHCSISAGVQIYTHDSINWALSGGVAQYDKGPVNIGDRCYIGSMAVIPRGSNIPAGSKVPAHALYKKPAETRHL
jgi:acetyltransferase-like isoleucine patch superfamily enzyme